MKHRVHYRLLRALCVSSAVVLCIFPPESSRGISQPFPDHIVVSVGVTDNKGNPVSGLPRSAFSVFDGKVPYEIESFLGQDAPTSIAVVFDFSGSIGGPTRTKPREKLLAAAREMSRLIESGNQLNEYFIITFNDDHRLMSHGSKEESLSALKQLSSLPFSGQSLFFDTCYFALNTVAQGKHLKKALVLISDGVDTYSRLELDDIRRLLKERSVVVYGLDIGEIQKPNGPGAARSPRTLEKLSELTGGLTLYPKNVDQVPADAQRIAADISARYIIGFKAKTTTTGKCSSFKVRIATLLDSASERQTLSSRSRQSHCPVKNK